MEAAGLPWLDVGIAAILVLSALVSLWRGFVREALGLLVWVLAIWAAVAAYSWVARLLPSGWDRLQLSLGETTLSLTHLRAALGFGLILLVVLLLGSVLNRWIVKHLFTDAFHLVDRLLGVAFGLARGALIVVGFVLLAGLTRLPFAASWERSHLVPWFQAGAEVVLGLLPHEYADYFAYPPNRRLPFGLGDKLDVTRPDHGSV